MRVNKFNASKEISFCVIKYKQHLSFKSQNESYESLYTHLKQLWKYYYYGCHIDTEFLVACEVKEKFPPFNTLKNYSKSLEGMSELCP